MFLPHPLVKLSIVGSLRDREVGCSASDLQGLNFEFCVWRAVSSHSFHHPQEVLLAQCAQKWPKASFISLFLLLWFIVSIQHIQVPCTHTRIEAIAFASWLVLRGAERHVLLLRCLDYKFFSKKDAGSERR